MLVCSSKPGIAGDTSLRAELSNAVVRGMGVAFRPKDVCFIRDLKKTCNLKAMRRVIRAAYLGDDPGDLSSLVNPEAIQGLRTRSAP